MLTSNRAEIDYTSIVRIVCDLKGQARVSNYNSSRGIVIKIKMTVRIVYRD